MNDRATLLAACLNEPTDDTVRLVYADWLREQDDAATKAIGRFVWAGVTLSRYRGNEPVEDGMFFDAQRELNKVAPQVLSGQASHLFGWKWVDVMWDQVSSVYVDWLQMANFSGDTVAFPQRGSRRSRQSHRGHWPAATYERGMLTALRLKLGEWRKVAPAVLAVCPLERVEVLDVPGLTLHVCKSQRHDGAWMLSGELSLPARRDLVGRMTGTGERVFQDSPAERFVVDSPAQPFVERASLVKAVKECTDAVVTFIQARSGDRWPGAVEVDDFAFTTQAGEQLEDEGDQGEVISAEELYEDFGGPMDSEDM